MSITAGRGSDSQIKIWATAQNGRQINSMAAFIYINDSSVSIVDLQNELNKK